MAIAAVGLAGCATTGPNHVYLTTATDPVLRDLSPELWTRRVSEDTAQADKPQSPSSEHPVADLPHVVAPDEHVLGLAYDYNTDHLFLRIAPGQIIRVIERPSGKVRREMPLPVELQTTDPADLAIRSSDRHLFAVYPGGRAVAELTLYGEFIRRIDLHGPTGPIGGLAYDQRAGRLLVLTATVPAQVGAVTADGEVTVLAILSTAVSPVSLGYDSDARHWYVPLANGHTLGEFDATGQLIATRHPAGDEPITGLDAGPRSFVRIF